jgi:hypothetical protein
MDIAIQSSEGIGRKIELGLKDSAATATTTAGNDAPALQSQIGEFGQYL